MTGEQLAEKYAEFLALALPFDVKVGYILARESAGLQPDQLVQRHRETELALHQWNTGRLANVKFREPHNEPTQRKRPEAKPRPDLRVEMREVKAKLAKAGEDLTAPNALENIAVLGRQLQSLQKRAGHL